MNSIPRNPYTSAEQAKGWVVLRAEPAYLERLSGSYRFVVWWDSLRYVWRWRVTAQADCKDSLACGFGMDQKDCSRRCLGAADQLVSDREACAVRAAYKPPRRIIRRVREVAEGGTGR